MIDRIKVILSTAVTYLVILAAVLTIVAEELQREGGDGMLIAAWIVRVIGILGVVVTIIRRVTPVLPQHRGLLGPPVDAPPASLLLAGRVLSPTEIASLKATWLAQATNSPQALGRPARWEPRRE